jgi:hypothetical protein
MEHHQERGGHRGHLLEQTVDVLLGGRHPPLSVRVSDIPDGGRLVQAERRERRRKHARVDLEEKP